MISAISVFNLKPCSSLPRAEQSRCREREREGERELRVNKMSAIKINEQLIMR